MRALILMTRIPIPGKTKTRLMEIFTGEECAKIHECFLMDLFNIFEYIKDDIDIFLTYTPEGNINIMKERIPHYLKYFPQVGDNLGERMANAIDNVLKRGYDEVILIGSDIPDILPCELIDAFKLLDNNDICLGPTFDGGYYLIGMKKLYKNLFDNKLKWGKKSVLEGTIDIANSMELSVGLAAKHMDIDTKEDIFRLKERMDKGEFENRFLPTNTLDYINKCWNGEKYAER